MEYVMSKTERSSGLPSTLILFVAILMSVLWGAIDINYHGHFQCATNIKIVEAEIAKRSHLLAYTVPDKDLSAAENDAAVVKCTCDASRKVVLTGKVDNANIRREFSDVVASAVGTNQVDNQIEDLNEDALKDLQALLDSPPTNMKMNYQVKGLGTIYLTGDVPSPEVKDRVEKLVAKIRGVRTVKNDLGRELQAQRMLRIHNIYFDFNQWKIRDQSQPVLDEVAQKVQEYLGVAATGSVRIEGHTDSIASNQYNQWLSEKRAQAVLEALVGRGIPRDRLKAAGKGESAMLVSPDDTPEKRAENRRIEFYFE